MAAGGLDGAGQAKMAALETATEILQRVHAQTERYALAVKQNQNVGPMVLQIKRGLEPLVGHLGVLDGRGLPAVRGPHEPVGAPGLWFTGYTNPISGALRELRIDAEKIATAISREGAPSPA